MLPFPLEPHYQGRSLSSWLQQCSDTPLDETQRLAEAQTAIRAMPVKKVLPRLLDLVEAKDDEVSLWMIAAGNRIKISDEFGDRLIRWHSAEDFQQLGIAGFEVLGTNAAPAVGELTRLLNDPEHAFTAARCLVLLGPSAEAPMCQGLTNANSLVRRYCASQLSRVFDNDRAYVAHLTNSLSDSDASVRVAAVQGIGAQTALPDLVIPILVAVVEKRDGNISSEAAAALAGFGTNALKAFTTLSNAVEYGNFDGIASSSLRTLVAIAPNEALSVVLQNMKSPDSLRRHAALRLLCEYSPQTADVEAAIQNATTDADPTIVQYAKSHISNQYQTAHPLDSQFPDEPSYAGKNLGEWLKLRDREGNYSDKAKDAFQHMGTNAIPPLLARLVYVEPPFGLRATEVNLDAVRAFIVLGDQAIPAIPRLESFMDGTNQDAALFSMLATCGTGSNAIPILAKGLTNQYADVRNEAANYLFGEFGIKFPERRRQEIPLLVKLLNDPDEDVRMNATNQLKEIDPISAARAGLK